MRYRVLVSLRGLRNARIATSDTENSPKRQADKPRAIPPKALLADPEITVESVAKRLNVAASTLYRHLPGGRGAVTAGK